MNDSLPSQSCTFNLWVTSQAELTKKGSTHALLGNGLLDERTVVSWMSNYRGCDISKSATNRWPCYLLTLSLKLCWTFYIQTPSFKWLKSWLPTSQLTHAVNCMTKMVVVCCWFMWVFLKAFNDILAVFSHPWTHVINKRLTIRRSGRDTEVTFNFALHHNYRNLWETFSPNGQ